jgi:DnaK suppressor protein
MSKTQKSSEKTGEPANEVVPAGKVAGAAETSSNAPAAPAKSVAAAPPKASGAAATKAKRAGAEKPAAGSAAAKSAGPARNTAGVGAGGPAKATAPPAKAGGTNAATESTKKHAATTTRGGAAKSSGPSHKALAGAHAPAGAAGAQVVVEEDDQPSFEFLIEQRALLLEERAGYVRQADELKAEADSLALEHEPGDVQFDEEGGEGGTSNVDRELDLVLSAQARSAITEIDRALIKIDAGNYGTCEQCGRPIPQARLKALPYAALCVACKSGGLSRR